MQTVVTAVHLKGALEKRKLFAADERWPHEAVWEVLGDLLEVQGGVLSLDGHQSHENDMWLEELLTKQWWPWMLRTCREKSSIRPRNGQ